MNGVYAGHRQRPADVDVPDLRARAAGLSSEAAGLRVMVNNVAHLFILLFFGSLGGAFGFVPVFVTNSALLVASGAFMRKKNRA